jgi:predicted DCC family thiol-disulfide oxidoreductase YuxK
VWPTPRRARPMVPDDPTVIYDGECGICRRSVDLLRRWDRSGVLRFMPFQDARGVAALELSLPALAAAMHLVLPDGRVYAGADAVPPLLRLLPGKRWLAPFFYLPGVLPIARRVYAWIAARRHCLVRGMPPG